MKDLLGDEICDEDELTTYLKKMDAETIEARSRNLEYICDIVPDTGFMMPSETFHVFTEARDSFVNGLYVATLLLTQAFIEHRLQIYMSEIGENKYSGKGLNKITQRLEKVRPQHGFILKKIDALRSFRNPFTHLKPFSHPHTISQVAMEYGKHPNEILYIKSKESIALMYTIATMDLR